MKPYFQKPSLLLLISLIAFVNQAQAQTQTCSNNILETAPASRFTINGDGTVTDTQTTLIWARCPQSLSGPACTGTLERFNWAAALALSGTRPTSVTTGPESDTDWRLPNVKELQSLVELRCINPAINVTVFPNTFAGIDSTGFWSASPFVNSLSITPDTSSAWDVNFSSGFVGFDGRAVGQSVRLVRDGSAQ